MHVFDSFDTYSVNDLDCDLTTLAYAPWQDGVTSSGYSSCIPGSQHESIVNRLEHTHYLQAKIQPFRAGGYEVSCNWVNAEKLINPPPGSSLLPSSCRNGRTYYRVSCKFSPTCKKGCSSQD